MKRDDAILRRLRDARTPEPDPQDRERAVLAALAVHDEQADERSSAAQGSALRVRPTGRDQPRRGRIVSHAIPWFRSPAFGPGVALACTLVLALLIVPNVHSPSDELATAPPGVGMPPAPAPEPEPPVRSDAAAPGAEIASGPEGFLVSDIAEARAADAEAPVVPAVPAGAPAEAPTPAPASARAREGLLGRMTGGMVGIAPDAVRRQGPSRDRFPQFRSGRRVRVAEQPVSTFSVDVDTASYSLVRRLLQSGAAPPRDAVRIEEMVNYFEYAYPDPPREGAPFSTTVAVHPTPWNANTQLLHVGLQGRRLGPGARPPVSLVFLVDTSGSMEGADRLPLLVTGLRMLLRTLRPDDRVALVTYAGSAGVVLEPTPATEVERIDAALTRLRAGGSTAGAEGLRTAYELAGRDPRDGVVRRVILATDGDFNVGLSDVDRLTDYVAEARRSGTYLSVLGFGQGNLNDALMQALAQNGDGQAAYVDGLAEARRVLVDTAVGSLVPIADDVKIQIEFNPARVESYRLIGYETRALRREEFRDDAVDAGEIGAGHQVTALYEIVPAGSPDESVAPLRYGTEATPDPGAHADELAWLRLRWKAPGQDQSRLMERAVTVRDVSEDLDTLDPDLRFAAAVAAFGQKLRGDGAVRDLPWSAVGALARAGRGPDPAGWRTEFLRLVDAAAGIDQLGP